MLLGARLYDPEIGRFLSPDFVLASTNQYTYTSGNPVLFMDDSGLFEVTVGQVAFVFGVIAVGAGIVAVLPISATVMIGSASLAEMAALTGAFARLGAFYFTGLGLAFGPDFPKEVGSARPGGSPGGDGGGRGPRGNGDQGTGGKLQFRNVVFQSAGMSLTLVYSPPAPSGCSPSTLDRIGGGGRYIWILLAVNLLLAVAWRRRSKRLPGTQDGEVKS